MRVPVPVRERGAWVLELALAPALVQVLVLALRLVSVLAPVLVPALPLVHSLHSLRVLHSLRREVQARSRNPGRHWR